MRFQAELTVFILSFLMSMLSTKVVIWFYHKMGWVEQPDENSHIKKTHHRPTPRGGGVPIIITFCLLSILFLSLDKYLLAIIGGGIILAIVGVIDDLINIHPGWRLIVGLTAGLIIVGSGIGIAYVTNPLASGVIHLDQPQLVFKLFGSQHRIWLIADLFALVFILWNINIVNWSKGVDGQLPAFVTVAFLFIGFLSDSFSSDPTSFNNAIMSFILAGSYLGLLVFNWYPQKIMPGYGGGSLAGYFLSVLAIISGAKVATSLMLLSVPTADAIFTIIRRIANGRSPIWGDRGHLHHQLLDVYGWGRQRISIFYAMFTLIMGILSLLLKTNGKIIMLITSFSLVFTFQIWSRRQIN